MKDDHHHHFYAALALKCDPDKYAVHFFAEKRLPAAICCYLWVSHVSKILSQDKKKIAKFRQIFGGNENLSKQLSWHKLRFQQQ